MLEKRRGEGWRVKEREREREREREIERVTDRPIKTAT